MNVTIVGGGTAGLLFATLLGRHLREARIRLYEAGRPDDVRGCGVMLTPGSLAGLEVSDPELFDALSRELVSWSEVEVGARGRRLRVRAEPRSAIPLRVLLDRATALCRERGVELEHGRRITDPGQVDDADLVVIADGAESTLRAAFAPFLEPRIRVPATRFVWMESTRRLDALHYIAVEQAEGLFRVIAYPSGARGSTWIVEVDDETWRRTGLDHAGPGAVSFLDRLLATHLEGHPLTPDPVRWRQSPQVTCRRWYHDKFLVLGEAARSTHFSAASGTRLALDDAMALVDALDRHGGPDPSPALAAFEALRRPQFEAIRSASERSRRWLESLAMRLGDPLERLAFGVLTRSHLVTHRALAARAPEFVAQVDSLFAREQGAAGVPPPVFVPLKLRDMELPNRIVVSPMCQYSAVDGTVGDWHLVHLGSRAVGGAGLVIAEMTDVSPEGRITPGCAGMWHEGHQAAWKRIVDFVHGNTPARIGIQLAHAGRKASTRRPWEGGGPLTEGGWATLAPSAIAFQPGWQVPRAMDRGDMDRVREAFVRATGRAADAGFDLLELHAAHGYLLSSFLSPLSNQREDDYGGPLENRMRFPLEVVAAVRQAWPAARPLSVRISASDWLDEVGGFTLDEAVEVARRLAELGCDLVDVSSGGNVADSKPEAGPMYQAPFAERIRREVGVRVMAVGGIEGVDHANTILAAGRADLCALARAHLREPYLTLRGALEEGWEGHPWPPQYLRARP